MSKDKNCLKALELWSIFTYDEEELNKWNNKLISITIATVILLNTISYLLCAIPLDEFDTFTEELTFLSSSVSLSKEPSLVFSSLYML